MSINNMMKKYKLGDICSFNKNTISRDEDINIEYLETSNLIENKILSIQNVKLSKAPSRAQRKVKHNTILYSTVRPNLKHYGIMKMPSSTMICRSFLSLSINHTGAYNKLFTYNSRKCNICLPFDLLN